MKLRLKVSCLCAPIGVLSCSVSVGGQALPTATGPAASLQVGVAASVYHLAYGERWLGGPTLWVNYNPTLHLGVQAEMRDLRFNEDLGVHATTLLAGPRLIFHRGPIMPYAKLLAGTGRLDFPYGYAHGRYFVRAYGGGMDVQLSRRIGLRLVDVEYQQWPHFSFGSLSSYGASAGVSINLHHGDTWRSEGR